MSSSRRVPSLQTLALKAVIRHYVSAKRVVELIRFFEKIDWMIEQGPALKDNCTSFVVNTFRCMSRMYTREVLQEILGTERLARLEAEVKQTDKEIVKMKILGKVVERAPAAGSTSSSPGSPEPKLRRSVSGKAAYPYETLKAGRSWPTDVIASKREEHLDTDEFNDVFCISYETYCTYPAWKRNQIKKEKSLF